MMEDLFEQLSKECNALRYISIKEDCMKAKDILESQSDFLRCFPSELRNICLKPLQDSLETRIPKLVSVSLTGYLKFLRDNQFYSDDAEKGEETWLASQVLDSLKSFHMQSKEAQTEILKIILSMCCVPNICISGQIVIRILDLTGSTYGKGGQEIKSLSQSAGVQAILVLLNQIVTTNEKGHNGCSETHEARETVEPSGDFGVSSAFDQLVPVVNYIATKLTQTKKESKGESTVSALFHLECTNSLLERLYKCVKKSLKMSVCSRVTPKDIDHQVPSFYSSMLVSSLWKQLCPSLIGMVGTPERGKAVRGVGRTQGQTGRGPGFSSYYQHFDSEEAKKIYVIACNIAVTMGGVGEMRPVVESLFHKILLYPPPDCRYDALKAVAQVMRDPEKLIQFAGPILHFNQKNNLQSDLSLFRLTIDSLIECSHCKEPNIQLVIVDCIAGLLCSVEALCDGSHLSLQHIMNINSAFPSLEDVDYLGPVTYQSQHLVDTPTELSSDNISHSSETDFANRVSSLHSETEGFNERDNKGRREDGEQNDVGDDEGDDDDDRLSFSSGDTEGPSNHKDELDSVQRILEQTLQLEQEQRLELEQEQEDLRLRRLDHKLKKKSENVRVLKDDEEGEERANALHFCATLQALLPSLLSIRSTIEVDEAVLEFSSKYCQGIFCNTTENGRRAVIVNGDGIYVTTYAVLLFNLKLIRSGFYCTGHLDSPQLTKDQFMAVVFESGVLVYLSFPWVSAVYDEVLKDSFLQRAGYNPNSLNNCALVNLIKDLDAFDTASEGSQMLTDYLRLERTTRNEQRSASKEAGRRLCRRIVTCCWESWLSVLSNVLRHLENESAILAPVRVLLLSENSRKDEVKRAQDILILSLNSLQSMIRLANELGLQKRCGRVFSLLSSACLPPNEDKPRLLSAKSGFPRSDWRKKTKFHVAHVLSFHVLLLSGLELGSHARECWIHLFRCCLYITEMERKFFSKAETSISVGSISTGQTMGPKPELRLPLHSELEDSRDEFTLSIHTEPEMCDFSIEDLMNDYFNDESESGFLSNDQSGKAICSLIIFIDKIFDEASNQLKLKPLVNFIEELCFVSESQLFSRTKPKDLPKAMKIAWNRLKKSSGSSSDGFVEESLLLHRLAEVVLKVLKSGRPLLHVMRVWAVAGPHFLKAACHRDSVVSKRAICCIHDVVNSMLISQRELSFFHFNEALFKPFEDLFRLELCTMEIQDQIVNSICEFVESCSAEIKSGWRPLFGALRCVRTFAVQGPTDRASKVNSVDCVLHLRAVKDVFEAFLNTDNVLVFANAAHDCLICLLKHVRGTAEIDDNETEIVVELEELVEGDLCLDALRFIERCAANLASMHMMPACPVFNTVHRISGNSSRYIVDCGIHGLDESYYWSLLKQMSTSDYEEIDYSVLWPQVENSSINLQEMDKGTGVLHVWYTLLEGLAGAVVICPKKYQSQAVDTLFSLMKSLLVCPGPSFGIYCINHFLIPTMQQWLRKGYDVRVSSPWKPAQSFKQYVGLTTDLVVEYLTLLANSDDVSMRDSCRLMIQQICLVLVECVSNRSEVISRLGCSCIRHVALSCMDTLPPELWDVLVVSIHRASQVALFPLYELMSLFHPDSNNFYGDVGQVKVAVRRDCTGKDSERLTQICHQVLQLEPPLSELGSYKRTQTEEDRSFIFLLFLSESPKTGGDMPLGHVEVAQPRRVPFNSLVVGLLASQMILQTLGQLVRGSSCVTPSLANVLFQSADFIKCSTENLGTKKGNLPGGLNQLSHSQILVLLSSLRRTHVACLHFDRRPGLKFLIEKVGQTEMPPNLYKLAVASWTLEFLTVLEMFLVAVYPGVDLNQVRSVLDSGLKSEDEISKRISPNNHPVFDVNLEFYVLKLNSMFSELFTTYLEIASNPSQEFDFDEAKNQSVSFQRTQASEFATLNEEKSEKMSDSLDTCAKKSIWTDTKESGNSGRNRIDNAEIPWSSLPLTMTLGLPSNEGQNVSQEVCQNFPQHISETVSQGVSQRIPENVSQGVSQRIPENVSKCISENVSQHRSQTPTEDSSHSRRPFTFADLAESLTCMDETTELEQEQEPQGENLEQTQEEQQEQIIERGLERQQKVEQEKQKEQKEDHEKQNEKKVEQREDHEKQQEQKVEQERQGEQKEDHEKQKEQKVEQEEQKEEQEQELRQNRCSNVSSLDSSEMDSDRINELGEEQNFYSSVAQRTISSVVNDFRRKKERLSLAPQIQINKQNHSKSDIFPQCSRLLDSVPPTPNIEEQRTDSIRKDSVACLKVRTQLVTEILEVVFGLKDNELLALLPTLYPSLRSITTGAHNAQLRRLSAQLLSRAESLHDLTCLHD